MPHLMLLTSVSTRHSDLPGQTWRCSWPACRLASSGFCSIAFEYHADPGIRKVEHSCKCTSAGTSLKE